MSLDKPMGYKPLLLAFLLVCSLTLKAQVRHYDPSNSSVVPVMGTNGNLGITGIGDNYDVKYYRLEAYINPDSATKYIRGKLTTYYQTLVSGFNLLKLDLRNNMIIDSIYYRGSKLAGASYVKDVDTLKITLTTRPANYLDSVSIFYRGIPDVGPSSTGFVKATHGSAPVKNYIYTLSEPYSARNWWPCKLDVRDKADSLDLVMTSPSAFMTAGNGSLISNTINGAYRTMVWKHRYPIPAYLVAIAVARYSVITSPNVTISGTSMPVFHYVFPEHNTAAAKTTLEKVRPMLTSMSTAFGDYPFKNEKYGHYEFGFSGGMEHSTFSGMNWGTFDQSTDWSVIAHELGHQWFGDQVTCGSWKDIWVNEGFAKFSELIAAENIPSIGSPTLASHRSTIKANSIAATVQTTYRSDTTSLGSIFSPSVYIYDRGAMILNMLRATLGDTKFFTALRNYTSDPLLSYKNALTGDVKRHMENVSGLNLTDFFNDWIYNNGHATYAITYGFSTNYVGIRAVQSKTSGSTATNFDMPLQFRVSNGIKDTLITLFYDDGVLNVVNNGTMSNWGLNNIGVRLSFTPTSIVFDPNSHILATTTSMT
ncbi:MAG: M1 family metallopeptidase, partial [Flavitalea sp.]